MLEEMEIIIILIWSLCIVYMFWIIVLYPTSMLQILCFDKENAKKRKKWNLQINYFNHSHEADEAQSNWYIFKVVQWLIFGSEHSLLLQ
jgi:hypothetical protein